MNITSQNQVQSPTQFPALDMELAYSYNWVVYMGLRATVTEAEL